MCLTSRRPSRARSSSPSSASLRTWSSPTTAIGAKVARRVIDLSAIHLCCAAHPPSYHPRLWSHAAVKTAVEALSPTRVRLIVEVSFEELKPSLDKAYREVAQQARIPGFRPGKVPPRVIDMRIGRGAVLTEAVNDALPEFYSKAVQEAEVFVLGQPDVEITQLEDGKELSFTAEVEVRPKFELPDLGTLTVTVEDRKSVV